MVWPESSGHRLIDRLALPNDVDLFDVARHGPHIFAGVLVGREKQLLRIFKVQHDRIPTVLLRRDGGIKRSNFHSTRGGLIDALQEDTCAIHRERVHVFGS